MNVDYVKCDRCGTLRPPAQFVLVVIHAQGVRSESRHCLPVEFCDGARK